MPGIFDWYICYLIIFQSVPNFPVSNVSRVFEKLSYLLLNCYIQNKFLIYLTGFWKNHGTQHALLKMAETWTTRLTMSHKVGAIYLDLSKVFDSPNYALLITKLKCYELYQNAV